MKKRKELGYELSSMCPPAKSRRLECDCNTMMMEEENNVAVTQPRSSNVDPAIVLYDLTATTPFLKSPSSPFSIVINTDFIPGLKEYLLSWGAAKHDDRAENEIRREKSSEVSNNCLAVVPWVGLHSPMASEKKVPEIGQPLKVEEGDVMEID